MIFVELALGKPGGWKGFEKKSLRRGRFLCKVDRQCCVVGLPRDTNAVQAAAREVWSELIVELGRVGCCVSARSACDGG